MALLRGVWSVARALGRSGAELCAGCGSRLRSPFSFVYVPKWFSSTSNGYPKRPANAYARFLKEKLSITRAQNPDEELVLRNLCKYPHLFKCKTGSEHLVANSLVLWHSTKGTKITEIMRRLGEQWKELPDAEKKIYEDAYKEEWKAYKEERNRINETLSLSERAVLAQSKTQNHLKRKGIIKKELLTLGKPKRPRTAYNIYLAEYIPDCEATTIQAKWKSAYENWKNLSDSQKQVYEQLAEDDKIRYRNEIKSWEEQMIEVGRSDLIRRKTK